jgi:hypothetical protein
VNTHTGSRPHWYNLTSDLCDRKPGLSGRHEIEERRGSGFLSSSFSSTLSRPGEGGKGQAEKNYTNGDGIDIELYLACQGPVQIAAGYG